MIAPVNSKLATEQNIETEAKLLFAKISENTTKKLLYKVK